MPRVLALVLAGGAGSRLGVLTDKKAKPALPVAGSYRLIDVSLSNLVHSQIPDVWIVQQYLPHTVNAHLKNGRPWDLDRTHGGLQVLPPYEGGSGEGFAEGNSDALFRQRELIRHFAPDLVLVLSADHLYTLDMRDVIDTHHAADADLTIVTTKVNEDPSRYAVIETNPEGTVVGFSYKPEEPATDLVAAEIFLFNTQLLLHALEELHQRNGQLQDYGDDLLPWFVHHRHVVEHRLTDYWMDLGTVQSYWAAHMQLLDGNGAVLDNPQWPILTAQPQLMPARVESSARVTASLLSAGSHIRGTVTHSVLGPGVVIEENATVRNCVLMDGVAVASGASLENVVADHGAAIPAGTYGSADAVTVIDDTGTVRDLERFDREATLPTGFNGGQGDRPNC